MVSALRFLVVCVSAVSSAFLVEQQLPGRHSQHRRATVGHAARTGALSMGVMKTVKLGLVGGGTVGGGIVEILQSKSDFVKSSLGVDVQVSKIVVGNPSKPRDFTVPPGCEVIGDINGVIDDDNIDVVVEVMGGTTLAKEVVVRSLKAGKSVVTANKALIAQDLPELEELLKSVNEGREGAEVQFGFEAAVCGGIPIIHALQHDFLGDDITQLSGIINGCTNFMLSSMNDKGLSYGESLAEASDLGYAEADPTLDVGGFDARSKLRIMMKLAFGVNVDEEEIPCRGITEVTSTDFEYAALIGGTVKLLGIAKLDAADSDKISAFVAPCFVPDSSYAPSLNAPSLNAPSLRVPRRVRFAACAARKVPRALVPRRVRLAQCDSRHAPRGMRLAACVSAHVLCLPRRCSATDAHHEALTRLPRARVHSTLSNINGATNAVQITSSSLQDSTFVGQGAGRFPTANSCVSDILSICQGVTSKPFPKVAPASLSFVNSFQSAFYVRIRFRDGTGIIQNVGEIMSACGVSIYSILQNPIKDRNDAQFVVMTDPVDVACVKEACVKLEAQDWCLGNTFYMPVL